MWIDNMWIETDNMWIDIKTDMRMYREIVVINMMIEMRIHMWSKINMKSVGMKMHKMIGWDM